MKTLTEKYRGVLNESFSKAQFVRDARMAHPSLINQFTSYNDAISILKNKGMISEEDKIPEYAEFENISDEAIRRGIDAELEAMGIDSAGSHSAEDHAKAKEKALKNLKKDPLHYLNLMSGESSKVDKHDQMVEPNEKNKVDAFNGMKKADLKEEAGVKPGQKVMLIGQEGNEKTKFHGQAGIITKDGKSVKLDKTGHTFELGDKWRAVPARDAMEEKVAKSVEDVIDPHDYVEIGQGYLKGFNRPHSLKDADLETLGRKVVKVLARGDINKAKAKFVDEVMGIDRKGKHKEEPKPSNYTKPNMEEELSDEDMKAIEKYGHPDKTVKPFKPGDMWSTDFDYEGMLEFGMKIRLNTPIATLQALYNSFEDVNYHSENSHLGMAIDAIEDGDKGEALDHIRNFKKEVKKTLVGINEGADPSRKQMEEEKEPYSGKSDSDFNAEIERQHKQYKKEAVVSERVGALQDFISLIQDKAGDSGFPEEEEAMEVIEAIAEHYGIKIQIGGLVGEELAPTGIGISQKQLDDLERLGAIAGVEVYVRDKDGENVRKVEYTLTNTDFEKNPDDIDFVESENKVTEKKGEDHDGDGDIDSKDYLAAKDKAIKKAMGKDEIVKENLKAIIEKVLEEGTINEAATQELAKMADSYAGFEGMKAVVMSLQDIVTDIERYYDNTRGKIQKAFDSMGEVRNEEGLKVGGFLSPAIESAFNKDLRPVIKQGFTKGLDQPKVKVLSQADLDAARMGGPVAEAEPKQTVYSPVNEKK